MVYDEVGGEQELANCPTEECVGFAVHVEFDGDRPTHLHTLDDILRVYLFCGDGGAKRAGCRRWIVERSLRIHPTPKVVGFLLRFV